MANSSISAKNSYHTRSVSLPSRAQYSQTANLEDQLCRLRSSANASTSSSSISQNLGLLNEIYESFDDLLQLPHAQQALSQCHQVEKALLDGSVKLLDICSMSKDALVIVRESLQKFESSLRRRRCGEYSAGADEVQNFLVSRKNIKRIVSRCSKNLSKMESFNLKINEIQGQNREYVALPSLMREIEAVNLAVLRSILSFVFGTEEKSLLSKLIRSKQTGKQGEVMEKMDQALESLKGKKTEKIDFHTIESVIQELEEALDCLFRRLLKSRVSLLNILNH